MLALSIAFILILAGLGAIAWLILSEKKHSVSAPTETPTEKAVSTPAVTAVSDVFDRLGLSHEWPKPTVISEPEKKQFLFFGKKKTTAGPVVSSKESPNVARPHAESSGNPSRLTMDLNLDIRYEDFQRQLHELQEKYDDLNARFQEKSLVLEKAEKTLKNEQRVSKEFSEIQSLLEKELEETRDKVRHVKVTVTATQTEAQSYQKTINQLEENVKKCAERLHQREDEIKEALLSAQQSKKSLAQGTEQLKAHELTLEQKNKKITDLVQHLLSQPHLDPSERQSLEAILEDIKQEAYQKEALPQAAPASALKTETLTAAPAAQEEPVLAQAASAAAEASAPAKASAPEQGASNLQDLRNIGIIAHIDAGKTTTTERILYYTGTIHKMGTVDQGNTTTDWMEQEKERGITITAANITCTWKGKKINVIDTPGHVDFTVEVERSLKVLDGAVVVLCATSGVQSQTETVWHQADRYRVPRICFINKIDRLGANFDKVIHQMHDRLGANAEAIEFPDGAEDQFQGIIDIIEQDYIVYLDEEGKTFERRPIPDALKERALDYRHRLLEKLSLVDNEIMEKAVREEEITKEDLKAAIRRAVLKNAFVPVLVGTALRNKGVQMVLDAITEYLPSPLDVPPITGFDPKTEQPVTRPASASAPLSALVFKIASDPYVGKLYFTRIYSGTITTGTFIYNASQQNKERLAKIVVMHANKQEIVYSASAGDIVALVGFKEAKSGNTLCDDQDPMVIESMKIPEPVVSMAIEPRSKADQDKMGFILKKFLDEDPSLRMKYDHETNQTILSGMGELHLEIIIDRMKREHNLETNIGRPQVAYEETITQKVTEVEGKFISQTGGRGQYGHCVINVEPAQKRGQGVEFINKIKGGVIPREYIPAVEKGIREGSQSGVLAGYPVTDFVVTLIDGSFHEVDSSEIAFHLAARSALREALSRGRPIFIEPIMNLECSVPEEFMGAVIGDLNTRRARIMSMGTEGKYKTARCEVPLSEMFNYANALRSLTQGRGTFSMEPAFYAEVPGQIAEKIKKEREEYKKRKMPIL